MDASTSVPQTDPPLDPDLHNLLSVAERFTHALSEGGAFDTFDERQAERYEAAMALIERGDIGSRRIAYLQVLDLLLGEPERFTQALTALHDQLAAVSLPAPDSLVQPQLDTLFVSSGVVRDLHQLNAPPFTRWIDGTLYIGASADHFQRVMGIDYDGAHQRAWLTTSESEQWLVLLSELAASRAA